MISLWEDQVNFVGVQLDKKEFEIVAKLLGRLSQNDLERMKFSTDEQNKISELQAAVHL